MPGPRNPGAHPAKTGTAYALKIRTTADYVRRARSQGAGNQRTGRSARGEQRDGGSKPDMSIRRRSTTMALLVAAIPICLAGVAWACAPSNWGWTPPATPQPTAVVPSASPTTAPPSAAPSPPAEPTSQATQAPQGRQATQVTESATEPSSAADTAPSRAVHGTPARSKQPARKPAGSTRSGQGSGPVVARTQRSGAPSAAATPATTRSAQAPLTSARDHAAPARSTHVAKAKATPSAKAKALPAPSSATAQAPADRWTRPAARPADGGLLPQGGDTASAPSAGSDVRLVFGAALLGLGLVGLFGGFAVAEARRRRVPATRSRPRD